MEDNRPTDQWGNQRNHDVYNVYNEHKYNVALEKKAKRSNFPLFTPIDSVYWIFAYYFLSFFQLNLCMCWVLSDRVKENQKNDSK